MSVPDPPTRVLRETLRHHTVEIVAALLLFLTAATSYYQLTSGLFWCGVNGAGHEIYYWSLASALQSTLFLLTPWHGRIAWLYRASQYAVLPLLVTVVFQLAGAYPAPFHLTLMALAVYAGLVGLTKGAATSWTDALRLGEGVLFILATLLIHSCLAFFILYTPGAALDDVTFYALLAASTGVAFFIVRMGSRPPQVSLEAIPPFALLSMVLLRAKLPDGTYDSIFYKATLPLMIADWRTALTAIPDPMLLGTNFLEIVNAQLRILDPTYSPALTVSLTYLALWVITPMASQVFWRGGRATLAANAVCLLLVSLTESLIAAGTAGHEPPLVLLLTAALMPGPIGWFFAASAAAIKLTALFFIPFVILFRALTIDRHLLDTLAAWWRRRGRSVDVTEIAVTLQSRWHRTGALVAAALCVALSCAVVGGQFYRNYLIAGRILAPAETLASITDPGGHVLARLTHDPSFNAIRQRGPITNVVTTLAHVATLDKWLTPTEDTFHFLPSSRLPLSALLLCLLALAAPSLRSDRCMRYVTLVFSLSLLVFLQFLSQGRYLVVASACGAFVIGAVLVRLLERESHTPAWAVMIIGTAVAFLAVGDQLVGSYINNGWDCRRHLLAPVVREHYDRPRDEPEQTLARLVSEHRDAGGFPSSVIPSVWCEPTVQAKPYMGANYLYTVRVQGLLRRYLDADPKRYDRLPEAVLALCYENSQFLRWLPPHVLANYTQVSVNGKTTILVSQKLTAGRAVQPLIARGFTWPGWLPSATRSPMTQYVAGAEITIRPNPIRVCDGTALGDATIHWVLPNDIPIGEVHAGHIGTVFARSESGSAATGKWVSEGMTFYLVDVAQPANVLATARARIITNGC